MYLNIENKRVRKCVVLPKKLLIPISSFFHSFFTFSFQVVLYHVWFPPLVLLFITDVFNSYFECWVQSWILFLLFCLLDLFLLLAFFPILYKHFYLYSLLVGFLSLWSFFFASQPLESMHWLNNLSSLSSLMWINLIFYSRFY